MNAPFHVLIVAAGAGERFGGTTPKQYLKIGNKSVLYHSIKAFSSFKNLKSIHVIINPDHAALYEAAVSELNLPPFIAGGKDRKESVNNGLKAIPNISNEDYILVHDGARPLVSSAEITAILDKLSTSQACSLALPITDTICHANDGAIETYIERDQAFSLQTPQGFHADILRRAHNLDSPATDDTSLVRALGVDVALIEGSKHNIKITTPEDLEMAKALLNNNTSTRTGIGFDVHAFETAPSARKLMLCGIHIPHDLALAGHSDADVGLHAITDAFLGAIGGGDIGDHFPPSDDQWKNANSADLLENVLSKYNNYEITNIDITLICEAPKISVHKDKMKERIANICEIDATCVNIKATTTERLGFTGREEGIAAQAVVSLKTWAHN